MKKALLVLVLASVIFSQIPRIVTYQGKITDDLGVGINDTVDVIFRIYDSDIAGILFSSNTVYNVPMVKGLFDAQFEPDLTREELSGDMFLEVEIDGSILTPRLPVTAAILAMKAVHADTSVYADTAGIALSTVTVDWDTLQAYPDTSDISGFVDASGDTIWGDIIHANGARSVWISPGGTDSSWIYTTGDTFHMCSNLPVDICMNNSLIISPDKDIKVTHNLIVGDSLNIGKGIKLGGVYEENWPETNWDTLDVYVTDNYADSIGVYGELDGENFGWLGGTVNGGADSVGIYGVGTDYAGYFEGRTLVDGMLEVSVGIDPPFVAFIPQTVRPIAEPGHPHRIWVDDSSPGVLYYYNGEENLPLPGPIDTMIAQWDSIRDVPTDIMMETENVSLLTNDANYLTTVDFTDLTGTASDDQIPDNITVFYADSAGAVSWADVHAIPAAWADGIDNIGFAKLRRQGSAWIEDSVTFIEGSNIVLTQSANSIIIASSGDDWGSQVVQHDTTLLGDGYATLLGTAIGNSIESSEITDLTIETIDIGDNQITVEKIADATHDQILTTDVSGNPQWEPKTNFLSTYLDDSWIIVGSSSFEATPVQMVGDVSITNLGVTEINWGLSAGQVSAVDIPIEDASAYYLIDNVEQALQDLGPLVGRKFVGLAPVSPQEDISNTASIHINKTGGSGDLLRLEVGGLNKFSVGYEGDINAIGNVTFYGGINDGIDFGMDGQVLKTDGLGDVFWGDEGSDNDWIIETGYIYAANTTDFVGIGTSSPSHFLHVEGESAEWEAVGYFKNHAPSVNAYGVYGRCDDSPGFGIGGHFVGGATGVSGEVLPTSTGDFVGVQGSANGGGGDNYGVRGWATGSTTPYCYGVKGIADGAGANYGIYGYAIGGTEDWAGYFDGNVNVDGNFFVEGISPVDEAIGFFKNNNTSTSAYGVMGKCDITPGHGVGGYFSGGSKGVWGEVEAGSYTGDFMAVEGYISGGMGNSYGVKGQAMCSGNAYGVEGYAHGSGTNYGVYGSASDGITNWAGYFDGDVHITGDLSVDGAFPLSGQWGRTDNYIYPIMGGDSVGIGTTTPTAKLDVEGDVIINSGSFYFDPDLNRFGIGTAAPGGAIEIFDGNKLVIDAHRIYHMDETWMELKSDAGITIDLDVNDNSADSWFRIQNSTLFEIFSVYESGNAELYGKLYVEGDTPSGEAIGYFKNTVPSLEAYGVYGECANTSGWGIGGYFVGGSTGAVGEVMATSFGDFIGLHGTATGGTGTNCGVKGEADCSGVGTNAYGLYGMATSAVNNYGVYAAAAGGTNNWAGYFDGNVHIAGDLDVSGTGGARAYTEMMAAISPGANGIWTNVDLSGHGVTDGDIVEIIIVNNSTGSLIGGAQKPGGPDRRVPIGAEGSTSFTTVAGAGGFVELYMETYTSMSAYVVGFWR